MLRQDLNCPDPTLEVKCGRRKDKIPAVCERNELLHLCRLCPRKPKALSGVKVVREDRAWHFPPLSGVVLSQELTHARLEQTPPLERPLVFAQVRDTDAPCQCIGREAKCNIEQIFFCLGL